VIVLFFNNDYLSQKVTVTQNSSYNTFLDFIKRTQCWYLITNLNIADMIYE
jgi:hypothetical protein